MTRRWFRHGRSGRIAKKENGLQMRNWAGNHEYVAKEVLFPQNVQEVRELVAQRPKLKALGTRHSFNDIADSPADLSSTKNLNRLLSIDRHPQRRTVTVQAGITYGQLCRELHREGYSLHNLASLPHISIAGACAT